MDHASFFSEATLTEIGVYNTLNSQFGYFIWGNFGKTFVWQATESKLQKRAARVRTSSGYDADANRLFRQLSWIEHPVSNTKSPNLVSGYLYSKFVKRYETRYSLIVPFPRTNFMKKSFSSSGAVLCNSLPYDMREAKSLSQFKQLAHLNCWFLSTVYTAFMKNRS